MKAINIRSAIQEQQQNCGSPLEAELLLAAVLKVSREYLHTWPEYIISPQQLNLFREYSQRRALGEPLAYILGTKEFWSLPFKVSSAVLIPRPETEQLVQQVLEKALLMGKNARILDLGTGSGAIALALATEGPKLQITAVDNSDEALLMAKENAKSLAMSGVEFLKSDWFSAFETSNRSDTARTFDIIVANPPYIASDDEHLQQAGLPYEPRTALVSAQNGFCDLKKIIVEAPRYLAPKGWLMLEHGSQQGAEIALWLSNCGFTQVQGFKDLAGLDRITIGSKASL